MDKRAVLAALFCLLIMAGIMGLFFLLAFAPFGFPQKIPLWWGLLTSITGGAVAATVGFWFIVWFCE